MKNIQITYENSAVSITFHDKATVTLLYKGLGSARKMFVTSVNASQEQFDFTVKCADSLLTGNSSNI